MSLHPQGGAIAAGGSRGEVLMWTEATQGKGLADFELPLTSDRAHSRPNLHSLSGGLGASPQFRLPVLVSSIVEGQKQSFKRLFEKFSGLRLTTSITQIEQR